MIRRVAYSSFLIVALSPLGNFCRAQDTSKNINPVSRIEIGLAGGLSLNRFSEGQPQTGVSVGYTGGVSLNYKMYQQWSIQIEANFLQQGGQLITFKDDTRLGLPEMFSTKNVRNSSVSFNSFEIPLLLQYAFKLKQSWYPQLYFGGSYAYNVNATDHYRKTGNLLPGEDIIATVEDSENVTTLFKRERINLIVGANVHLPLCRGVKMLLDFRYMEGLSPAREHYSYIEKLGFGSDIRSSSFVSKLGIVIPIR